MKLFKKARVLQIISLPLMHPRKYNVVYYQSILHKCVLNENFLNFLAYVPTFEITLPLAYFDWLRRKTQLNLKSVVCLQ